MRRLGTLFSVALMMAASPAARAQYYDDFNSFHDWIAGGVAVVPPNGIWDGIHNAANGGVAGSPGIFQSSGVDGAGIPKPGVLLLEDRNTFAGPGSPGIGWEGSRTTAPMPYIEIPSNAHFTATVKINAQTSGQWSSAGIVARRKGPPVGVAPADRNENFVAAYSFRTNAAQPTGGSVLTTRIVDGVQVSQAQTPFGPNSGGVAPFPNYLRLTKTSAMFTSQTSLDGTTWSNETTVNAPILAADFGTIEVGPTFQMSGGGSGAVEFDEFRLDVALPDFFPTRWTSDAGGSWADAMNWSPQFGSSDPKAAAIENRPAPTTVFVDQDATAQSLKLAGANRIAIAGTATLTFQHSSGLATILVGGSHEIQARTKLGSSTRLEVTNGGRIDFNHRVDLNSHTLTVLGDGVVSLNAEVAAGSEGQVVNRGTLTGSGTIHRLLYNDVGGTVRPGNGIGTLVVLGTYIQVESSRLELELGGTAPGTYDCLRVSGTAALRGAVSVQLVDGFMPSAGDIFDILDFGTLTNGFTLDLPSLADGLSWDTSLLPTQGILSVRGIALVPEPSAAHTMGLALLALNAWQVRRKKARR